MNKIKGWAWALLKPFLATWLQDRALTIPLAERKTWASRLKVSDDTLTLIEGLFKDKALAELDKVKF